ncbi:hypothetical protein RhiirA5_421543 [Rhizophagus irregularis]|uniref:Uncharacterized protein n=1 Tax=Rhizophagus irregularis TaxID=588596 RepID=A0A2N0PDR1_9GLOM|nr:hypothetical protein RhiirA5_421543 [Rhizophagus irregularis]
MAYLLLNLRDDRDNVRFTDITDIANINDIANITDIAIANVSDITDIADIYCSQYRSERSGLLDRGRLNCKNVKNVQFLKKIYL